MSKPVRHLRDKEHCFSNAVLGNAIANIVIDFTLIIYLPYDDYVDMRAIQLLFMDREERTGEYGELATFRLKCFRSDGITFLRLFCVCSVYINAAYLSFSLQMSSPSSEYQ